MILHFSIPFTPLKSLRKREKGVSPYECGCECDTAVVCRLDAYLIVLVNPGWPRTALHTSHIHCET